MYKLRRKFIFVILLLSFLPIYFAFASTTDGTVGSSYTSILLDNTAGLWSSGTADTEKIFWDTPSPYDVHITDSELTGYLWGPGVGWISLNCSNTSSCGSSNFKVANTDAGELSGYAWGENTGWISFSCANEETDNCSSNNNAKVTVGSDGKLAGYAWSQNFGWIKFDCSSASSCVQTDWRPASVRNQSSGSGSGGSGGSSGGGGGIIQPTPANTPPVTNTPSIPEVITFPGCSGPGCQVVPPKIVFPKTKPEPTNSFIQNNPLVITPEQVGKLEQEVPNFGKIIVNVSPKTSREQLTFIAENNPQQIDLSSVNFQGLPQKGQGYIFHIYAKNSNGVLVQKFDKDILITLPLPEALHEKKVRVFQRPEDSSEWSPVSIQELTSTDVVISADHLSYFLVTLADNQSIVPTNFSWFLIILIIVVIFAILTIAKRKKVGSNL